MYSILWPDSKYVYSEVRPNELNEAYSQVHMHRRTTTKPYFMHIYLEIIPVEGKYSCRLQY